MTRKQDQIRLQNLERLIREAGSVAELAKAAGTNKSYLSQVRHQTRTPSGTPRRVGDEVAGMLEAGMGKPEGWMDERHEAVTREFASGARVHGEGGIHTLCPLISWVQAGAWRETCQEFVPDYDTELLPCPVRCSSRTFVLRVAGVSMEPDFHEGDLVFVDPEVVASHGKYVVVLLNSTNETTFKQLVVEGERQYLRALNPAWPERIIEIDSDATICGVVVFKGMVV